MICETEEEIYEVFCKHCGSQRCDGVYDKEWREGCSHYKKFIDLKNKKNNFTISDFDPILEMIESGKGIPPITDSWVESPISKDTFYCSNCDYSPDIESINYMNYCPNCGKKLS